ncbi:MAG: hypothetical protein ACOVOT_04645 [Rubrivivax sp.]|nr:hypothetical protein [Rubrivivax sp.]
MPHRLLSTALALAALASAPLSWAQGPAPAAPAAATPTPSSPEKKRLVERVIQLQMPGVENLGRQLAEQPALMMGQQASQALQRLPAERREAVARDIQADLRQYVEEMAPPMRDRAVRLAPGILTPMLEERFSEQELREVIVLLESPTLRKFQNAGPEMQRALGERIVAEGRASIEARAKVLEQSIVRRLNPPAAPGSAPAPAPAPTAAPAAPRAPAR